MEDPRSQKRQGLLSFEGSSEMLAELNVVFWFVGAYSVVVLASLSTLVAAKSEKRRLK
jgi:hypothetical protein